MSSPKGTIVLTGASGGLGVAIVSRIVGSDLGREYHGIFTLRDVSSPGALAGPMQQAQNKQQKHELQALDLSSLASVRALAASINKRVANGSLPRIRALILNAGYQESTGLKMTQDGFEITFQVNYLAHFLLTLLLLESMDREEGRILVVSSWSHDPADERNLIGMMKNGYADPKYKTLLHETEALARGKWSLPDEKPGEEPWLAGYRRYGAAKLCEVAFMHELQARLERDPVLSNISTLGMDPGGMNTGLLRRHSWGTRAFLASVMTVAAPLLTTLQANPSVRTTAKSANDALYACFDTKTLGPRPRAVYLNGNEVFESSPESRDEKKRKMLWEDSVRLLGLTGANTALQTL